MAFDYKKEYKQLYSPKAAPHIVTVPPMNFAAVSGKGDPNTAGGEYEAAVGLLYAISYTLKMSGKGGRPIAGYFDYAVPPLEGFWAMPGVHGFDPSRKELFEWQSVIRLPDFVTETDFNWAATAASAKKKADFSKARFVIIDEGLCVQCMHTGPFDDEPATVAAMDAFAEKSGYTLDFTDTRRHHEIYLSDPRKCAPDKLKTVIRHPIRG